LLKPPFKSSLDYRYICRGENVQMNAQERTVRAAYSGECIMAGFEFVGLDKAMLGEGAAAGESLFELGMKYSVGIEVPVDLISAHMWFNLAAAKGNAEAVRLRREIANQMSDAEVAAAQRAARDWLALDKRETAASAIAA
jgi:uncharacterized protein